MNIKKIEIKLKSGYITEFESYTFLSYIFSIAFAMDKKKVIQIFEKFKNKQLPFVVSN